MPVGSYSQQVLDDAGVTVEPASLELDIKATLAKVTSGEADAAIVYQTDIRSSDGEADAVDIPDDQNAIAIYPIAVLEGVGQQGRRRGLHRRDGQRLRPGRPPGEGLPPPGVTDPRQDCPTTGRPDRRTLPDRAAGEWA